MLYVIPNSDEGPAKVLEKYKHCKRWKRHENSIEKTTVKTF